MINQNGNNVPDKTIAVVFKPDANFDESKLDKVIYRPGKNREWFDAHFYHCLPLAIGNQYGFVIVNEFDFSVVWNGEEGNDAIQIWIPEDGEETKNAYPHVSSHFGSGVLTLSVPFSFRTPPGVNLMTINPPNFIVPNVTVMTGVVETDNLSYSFSFNLKIQMPNIGVHFPKGTPLAAFIPIPRYFADQFEIVNAREIFDAETIAEEEKIYLAAHLYRKNVEPKLKPPLSGFYRKGENIVGDKFPDHQVSRTKAPTRLTE